MQTTAPTGYTVQIEVSWYVFGLIAPYTKGLGQALAFTTLHTNHLPADLPEVQMNLLYLSLV
jgi:hypothetical protein